MRNIFSLDPVAAAEQRQSAPAPRPRSVLPPEPEAPKAPATPRQMNEADYAALSSQHRVPPNIIQAVTELANVDPSRAAEVLGDAMQQTGGDVEAAVSNVLKGDQAATRQLLDAAENIAARRSGQTIDGEAHEIDRPLLKQRGQQVAQGATEAVAAIPESIAITGATADQSRTEEAARVHDQRAQMIADMTARLQDDDLSDRERAIIERNLADLQVGQEEIAARRDSEVVPASERPVYARGDQIRDASADLFGAPDPKDDSFWGQVAQGAGNMAAMVGTTAAGAVAGGPAGALAVGGIHGSAMTQADVYREAIESGADEDTAQAAARWGAVIGASEILPISRALRILPNSVRGRVTNGVLKRFAHVAESAGEEAAQEYLATVAQNIVASGYYDPERGWTEGAAEGALVGAILGAGTGTIGALTERSEPDLVGRPVEDAAPASPPVPASPAPSGPLSRAAEAMPDMPPSPSEGAEFLITTPEGARLRAVFAGEDADGMNFTMDGKPLRITRAQMEEGSVAVAPVDVLGEAGQKQRDAIDEARQSVGAAPLRLQNPVNEPGPLRLDNPERVPARSIAPPDQDISTPEERAKLVAQDIQEAVATMRLDNILTEDERGQAFDILNAEGGAAEDVIMDIITRGIAHVEDPDAYDDEFYGFEPDPDPFAGDPAAPEGQPGAEGGGAAPLERGAIPVQPERQPEAAPESVAVAAENADPAPTDGQKEAGNYRKGHATWNGLNLTVENKRGSERSGTDPEGNTWSVQMPGDYGYIKRTEGADGDHVDFYMGPDEQADTVFVIDQYDAESGKFDEHKVIFGTNGRQEAEDLYDAGFSDGRGPERRRGVSKMTIGEFKEWLANGNTKKPLVQKAPKGGSGVKPGAGDISPTEVPASPDAEAVAVAGARELMKAEKAANDRGENSGLVTTHNGAEVRVGPHKITSNQWDGLVAELYPEPEEQKTTEAGRPSGFTFKLADRLDKKDNTVIARYRETPAGEVIAELDGLARRAESAMRQGGTDVRGMEGTGQNQWLDVIEGAAHHARQLAAELRQTKGEGAPWPGRDEDTGDVIMDGSAMSEALQFLEDSEAMSPPIDGIAPGSNLSGTTDTDSQPLPEDQVFPSAAKTTTYATMEKKGPFIEQDEATAKVAEWKRIAKEIGESGVNRNRLIVSLFDYTGAWSQPFADAGYQVVRHDIKTGTDIIRDAAYVLERVAEYRAEGYEIAGVLSACPCTTFAGSGARWWQDLHDVESPEAVEKVFGRAGLLSGAKSPLAFNVMLYEATRDVVREAAPEFHVLENPIGRIQTVTSVGKPLLRFHPSNFGDPYTKHTQLFGDFNPDLPTANVKAVDGSKMQSQMRGDDPLGKEQRSTTPEGFAYAFFMANDPEARKRIGAAQEEGQENAPAAETTPKPAPVKETAKETAKAPAKFWAEATDPARREMLSELGEPGAVAGQAWGDLEKGLKRRISAMYRKNPSAWDRYDENDRQRSEARKPQTLPGYERQMLGGEPTTTQTRMTDDGFVVKREVNRTQVIDPTGKPVFTGRHDAKESDVEQAIEARRAVLKDSAEAKERLDAKRKGPRKIGENARGKPLFEDENGVRSYSEGSIHVSENVSIIPGKGSYVDQNARGRDHLTKEEWEAKNPPKAVARQDTATENPGILGALSQEKQDRAAELKKRLAAKVRNQINSGLDPEYITLGGELVTLYIEAGAKRFADMLRDFAETTGLTMREAQAPMRAAYSHVRDEKDLAGEDVSDMDDASTVMAAIREAIAAEEAGNSTEKAPSDKGAQAKEGQDDGAPDGQLRDVGESREPEAQGGLADGERSGEGAAGPLAGQPSEDAGEPQAPRGGKSRRARPAGSKDRSGKDLPEGGDADVGRGDGGDGGLASDGARDGQADRDGQGDGGSDAGDADSAPRKRAVAPSNYVITDPEALIAGGSKKRFAANKAAIEAFQDIVAEGREPTREELDSMASYIGWGSFGQELFQGNWQTPRPKAGWEKEDAWLRQHLGQGEWESAQKSIINAHYTDPPTVQAMWSMLERMGFKGGRVLEPSMGIGNFFGMMPQNLARASQLFGIELDKLTGGMAKILYPQANISIKGYEKSETPDDFYDVVIGNWPFAKDGPVDRRYSKLSPSLHDYFFVKALDQVRPGGIVIGITSAGTMDKKARNIRSHLARNAELVDAFRLPSGAFESYAGTKVVTDIIILKKRPAPVTLMSLSDAESAWIDVTEYDTPAGTPITVNRHFAENPSKVLGTLNFGAGSTFGHGRAAMIVDRPENLLELLQSLPERLPKDAFEVERRGNEERFVANNSGDRVGSVVVQGDKLFVSRGEVMEPLSDVVPYAVKDATKTAKREDQMKRLVNLRKLYGVLIDAERDGLPDVETRRKALKKAYTAFRKDHGSIADSDGLKVFERKALNDPYVAVLKALEKPDGSPSSIMDKASVRSMQSLDNPTVAQAFVMARNESITLDLDRVAELSKTPRDKIEADLLKSKAIYRTPGGGFEVSDVFLSGNVRRKMRELQEAAAQGEDVAASIDALKEVIPADVPYYQIEAKLGATWVNDEHYVQYIADKLSLNEKDKGKVAVQFLNGTWKVRFDSPSINSRPEATTSVGHNALSFSKLMQYALNNQSYTVRYKDTDGKMVVDEKATGEVAEKMTKLREDFGDWLWSDPERRVDMEKAYNEAMNAIAIPRFDGSFLEFPGMALQLGENDFNLRKHQVNAIWRGLVNRRGLYAHEVGTGKTFTMGGLAVESRRYGIAKKPLILGHNANSAAVAAEINMMYPGAKVLYLDNLSPKEIDTNMRRIANEDWDAIVVPHSVIDRFSMREETLLEIAQEEIDALEAEALSAAEEDGVELDTAMMDDEDAMKKVRSVTAKNLVKARNQIIARVQKQAQRASREGAIPFEDLGIDMVIVDEAHEFKKPPISTKMQMKGLNTQSSERSIQLKFLTDYVKKQRGGDGIHTFTGTPITNTLTEIFHQMRYVMDDVMSRNSVKDWDSWFNTFADSGTDVELSADGQYEPVTRLSAFVNVAELRRMAGEFMDIVFADEMPEFEKRKTSKGKTLSDDLTKDEELELRDGRTENPRGRPYKKVVNDIAEMGAGQKEIMQQLVARATTFRQASRKDRREMMLSGSPNTPIRVETDAANASLDVRLFAPGAREEADSKVNRAVRNISHHFREHPQSTQVVFMERGFSSYTTKTVRDGEGNKIGTEKVDRLNLADDIVAKLVAEGIPEAQIAVVDGSVNKMKRKEIADKMNRAEIRVVIGSTGTLGVGVNMQVNLRAMHHLDAPWMPGDLEQRNGRGQRQGNKWNTVFEYRYITEKLDGRRWQVLTIKDQFIRAFLKADEKTRIIDGDATTDQEGENADELAQTLSDAAGDPRLLLVNKFKADLDKLERRERSHTQGTVTAKRRAANLMSQAKHNESLIGAMGKDADAAEKGTQGEFVAKIGGKSFDDRAEALEALEALVSDAEEKQDPGEWRKLPVSVYGFDLWMRTSHIYATSFELRGAHTWDVNKPSIRSIETTIRNIPGKVDRFHTEEVEGLRESAERLEKAAQEPFAQAEALANKRKQLDDLEADMAANPVPPPAWLRNGAPVQTTIHVDGEARAVTGHRWTNDGYFVLTDAGAVPYLQAKDADGARIFDEMPFERPIVEASKDAKQKRRSDGQPDSPTVRAITADLNASLERLGFGGRVRATAWRQIKSGPLRLDGFYSRGDIGVASDVADPASVLNHELIHALRDADLWGGEAGIFTRAEWRSLVRAARADKALMARVAREYADASAAVQVEEAIAELYARFVRTRETASPVANLLRRIGDVLEALGNALLGNGFNSAGRTFREISSGKMGQRAQSRDAKGRFAADDEGPDDPPPGGGARQKRRSDPFKEGAPVSTAQSARAGLKRLTHSIMTQAMKGANDGSVSLLAMVPGRALYNELGANLPGATRYLELKEEMDALRNKIHARMDKVAKDWRGILVKDRKSNEKMMDLMHEATIAQIDPAADFVPVAERRDPELVERYGLRSKTGAAAQARIDEDVRRFAAWQALRRKFLNLPAPFQAMYRTVRDEYSSLADAFEQAIIDNAEKAMNVAVRRAERAYQKRLDEIRDDGLKGEERAEAIEEAKQTLENAKAQGRFGKQARLASLRAQFESNRLGAPYFPLARFGDFYVTARDEEGKVVSFSRFELEKDQFAEGERLKAEGYAVEMGAMATAKFREVVDPNFVADVEGLLEEVNVSADVMDEIWQRWLHTLPDLSVRKNRIHRKGTPGFHADAFRAFGYQMSHGGHQLARLKYGLDMTEALEVARLDARDAPDPTRADLIVNEMQHRHEFVMNPTGSNVAQAATTAAFVWYLGITPAAAISNLTQTTVVGAPILGAFYGKGGVKLALKELTRALGDFTKGKAWAENSKTLTADERAAMKEAYERGVVDKSQAHDLVGIGETGIEYNRWRTAVMEKIAFFFHHAERLNREITFLAAYRMARAKGFDHGQAVAKAGELTWKSHFDYQNTSRPRIMQNDWLRVALVFKNFQTNMLWRLFRDIHQSFNDAEPEARAEARRQLIGITASMFVHAGFRGVWGYSLLMALLGMFFPDGEDDLEEGMEQTMLAVLPKEIVQAFLHGVPGTLMGIDVTSRWGMPDLWFRSSDRELSGEDEYGYWLRQFVGAVPGIAEGFYRGADRIGEGEWWKGVETMVPKAVRDVMKSLRYSTEGATTFNGNEIIGDFSPLEIAAQFSGFTPARLSHQYELNTRDKNKEQRIIGQRSQALRDARMSLRKDGKISDAALKAIREFNREYPFYAITAQSLRQSIKSGIRSSQNTEGGVYLNPKLRDHIQEPRSRSLFD